MRLLFAIIALLVSSTAWANYPMIHNKYNTKGPGKIETYFFSGYNDDRNPTLVVTDGSDTLSAGDQFVTPFIPVFGAAMVVWEFNNDNGAFDDVITIQVATVDTLNQQSIAELADWTSNSVSANHGAYVVPSTDSLARGTGTPGKRILTPPTGDDSRNVFGVIPRWVRFKLTATGKWEGFKFVCSVFYPNGTMSNGGDVALLKSVGPLYSPDSPWNTPISKAAAIHANSDSIISRIHLGTTDSQQADLSQGWNSTNDSYTMPIYPLTYGQHDSTTIYVTGSWYEVYGDSLCYRYSSLNGADTFAVRIPALTESEFHTAFPQGPRPSGPWDPPGDIDGAVDGDGHVILWDPISGDEWGFFKFNSVDDPDTVRNGYHYNTNWDGIPPTTPDAFGSRGMGAPYLAGVIRRDEVLSGEIKHAIACGVPDILDNVFVCPATKTDGDETLPYRLWAGARLRLKKSYDVEGSSLTDAGKVVARAMQRYGLIVADGSGSLKIYAEGDIDGDADTDPRWGEIWSGSIIASIPFSEFEVIDTTDDCTP